MAWHYIGLDTHCQSTDLAWISESGRVQGRAKVPTTIPKLVEAIEAIPRKRAVVLEEGPLADWLYRNLLIHVDQIVVANPRRNALIAKESDKDDPIDAEKLAQLLRGDFLKPVHHPETLERMIFKQQISLYHDQVRHRVREANRVMAQFRRWGVFLKEKAFADPESRLDVLKRVSAHPVVSASFSSLFAIYDTAVVEEKSMRRCLVRQARREEQIRRWIELPGISWIRAATIFAFLDTPWRFKSKSALWRYMGIGLERRHSGGGIMVVRVSQQVNRRVKSAIIGAAKSAIAAKNNPFAEQYERWREAELSPRNARRNVARSLAAVLWGMWKNGNVYRPEWVGVPAGELVP